MGGCRCSFRDCKVNTYRKLRMHFFHFPLKDSQRYGKWRQYAKKEEMVNYSSVKQKNMVVCARHFRSECFMNYKMDRLTRNAVPTITRLSETQAVDYELDMEFGVLVTLKKPTLNHLIAPQNYECYLYLDTDEQLLEKMQVESMENEFNNVEVQTKMSIRKQQTNEISFELSNLENNECTITLPSKSSSNSVQILETIQVSAPHSKRPREDASSTENTFNKRLISPYDANVPSTSQSIKHLHRDKNNQIIEESNFILTPNKLNNDVDDDDVEIFEIQSDADTEDYFNANDPNATIVKLKSDHLQDDHSIMKSMKIKLLEAQNEISLLSKSLSDAKVFEVKVSNLEKENLELKEKLKENEHLKKILASSQKKISQLMNSVKDLQNIKENLQKKASYIKETNTSKEQLEFELEQQHKKHLKTETRLQQHISTLEESLELTRQQLSVTKNNLYTVKSSMSELQLEKLNLSKQNMEIVQSLQTLQNNYDMLDQKHKSLKSKYDCLQQNHTNLEERYLKLETLQNQSATVTTSLDNTPNSCPPLTSAQLPQPSMNTLTKAQLFNSIKRYVSASMASLLRMEMFGSSEREWKTDERQVAVDLLRLGETVYKYFTDEWRFRLPALSNVRNWLNQSVEMNDEEDL